MASVIRTETQTPSETVVVNEQEAQLRLQPPSTTRGVQWAQGTVDNENMGKKSSKSCCIYKKPKKMGESSSESDSSSDDENPYEKGKKHKKKCQHNHSEATDKENPSAS